MKTFKIPLVDKMLYIYVGEDDWEKFKKDTIKEGVKESVLTECPEKGCGRAYGGWVWVYSLDERSLILHELSHFIDDLMDNIGSEDTEFRAYIAAWVFDTVLKWAKL